MHVYMQKDTLTKYLVLVQSIVEKKKTLPILANVLLRAENNLIYLIATDLEISIEIQIEAEIKEEGTITLPAKKFYEITKEMPEQNISIKTEHNNWISIESGKSKFNLAGIDASEYPNFSIENNNIIKTYNSKKLKKLIDKTLNCISNDEKKFNLNGLYIHCSDKMLHYVATDGHRLICINEEYSQEDKILEEGIIVPKKGLLELKKICETIDKELDMRLINGKIIFNIDTITLSIRLIDATFPKYQRVIPEKTENIFTIDTQHLYEAIKRVSIIADEKKRTVNIQLKNNNLEISSTNEYGNATETIQIDYALEERESKFKANYLMDILSSIDAEKIEFLINTGGKPSLIVPEKQDNYRAVLMPISM